MLLECAVKSEWLAKRPTYCTGLRSNKWIPGSVALPQTKMMKGPRYKHNLFFRDQLGLSSPQKKHRHEANVGQNVHPFVIGYLKFGNESTRLLSNLIEFVSGRHIKICRWNAMVATPMVKQGFTSKHIWFNM